MLQAQATHRLKKNGIVIVEDSLSHSPPPVRSPSFTLSRLKAAKLRLERRDIEAEWGLGYGESEYEVSFGLAHWDGELSPSEPKTPEPFNSPLRAQNPEQTSDSNSPQNLGSVGQNVESRGIYTQG